MRSLINFVNDNNAALQSKSTSIQRFYHFCFTTAENVKLLFGAMKGLQFVKKTIY